MSIEKKHIDRQFNRIYLSIKDLEGSIAFASEAIKAHKEIVRRALIITAISSYSRPFSKNKSHKSAASKPNLNLAALSAKDRLLHNKLCEIRNTAIAHSDFPMNPCHPARIDPKYIAMWGRPYDPLSESPKAESVRALGEKVKQVLMSELSKLRRHAVQHKTSRTANPIRCSR